MAAQVGGKRLSAAERLGLSFKGRFDLCLFQPLGRVSGHFRLEPDQKVLKSLESLVIPSPAGESRSGAAMWTKEGRIQHAPRKEGYPSDLTDAEWNLIRPFIPEAQRGGRPRKTDMRGSRYRPSRLRSLIQVHGFGRGGKNVRKAGAILVMRSARFQRALSRIFSVSHGRFRRPAYCPLSPASPSQF